jgi:hypothetical protein
MLWGDGFEIETVLNCRVAAAGLRITEVPSVERQRIFGRTNLRTFADGTRVLRTLAAERRRAVRRRARGAGRLAPRFGTVDAASYGTDGYGAESYGSGSYSLHAYDTDGYDDTGFGPAGYPGERDEPAFTPAGGIAVTPREPSDAAGDAAAARSPRLPGRQHERSGTATGTPANRDRSGVRYALEEEPS